MPKILIINCPRDAFYLEISIAGLSFLDRLTHISRKAGFDNLMILTDKNGWIRENEFIKVCNKDAAIFMDTEKKWAFVPSGCLPSEEFLAKLADTLDKDVKQVMLTDTKVISLNELDIKSFDVFSDMKKYYDYCSQIQSNNEIKIVDITEEQIFMMENPYDIAKLEDRLFKSLVKDTEGFMSKHVERKISLSISRSLVNTRISPNQMTLFSMIIGLIGALLISIEQGLWQVSGASLFLMHSILDGCDGEIARIKYLESKWGGVLDYWSDNLVHAAVFLCIAIEWGRRVDSCFPLLLAWIAILGTFASAGIIYLRTMHKKNDRGPLYTSVSNEQEKNKMVKIADYLSRRDFIYLVLILAIIQKLNWFLVLSSIGAPTFFIAIIWIYYNENNYKFKEKLNNE